MPNALSFDISATDADTTTVIIPCIDGIPLTTLVEQFERGNGMTDPAGGYGGLVAEFFDYGPLQQYFAGRSNRPAFAANPGNIFVLGCECGELGCWPLTCRVSVTVDQVIWHDFRQPQRPRRDYSLFGPFRFAATDYAEALKILPE